MRSRPSLLVVISGLAVGTCAIAAQPPEGDTRVRVPGLGTLDFGAKASGAATTAPGQGVLVSPLDGPGGVSSLAPRTVVISNHGLGIRAGGAVEAWGSNSLGQTSVPPSLGAAIGVASGQNHSYALLGNGSLVGWGSNQFFQTQNPANLGPVRTIETAADSNLAVETNGTFRIWGCENCPFNFGTLNVPAGINNVVEIDAEGCLALVRLANGQVIGWGCDTPSNWPFPSVTCGQAQPPALPPDIVQIAAGTVHALALRSNGQIIPWGANCPETNFGQAVVPPGLNDVIAIAAGAQHSLALRSNGTVVAWGLNFSGQTSVPAGLSDVVAIDAKLNVSSALRRDGTVVVWGDTIGGVGAVPPGAFVVPSTGCYANCDESTVAPILNAGDFSCFLGRFRSATSLPVAQQIGSYANCDSSTTPPVLNAGDFSCFLSKVRQGCP